MSQVRMHPSGPGGEGTREALGITIWLLFSDCSSLAVPPAHRSSGLRDTWAVVSLQLATKMGWLSTRAQEAGCPYSIQVLC